ncbi:C4-dicarboxylate ABC transporter substrate-binding protein [Anaerobacillus arseniciselenatis]|uniref:C4-dicarboxylate ABC transporter substrate-binding protein n=1 Tax=Anaerobacillus arseniciselenatis TaxID=85682 RepID=A0A1S2L9D1_9BACI|nr:TAXI family TRAP transporter solute-binding subunit [Anaerobacillus arseniciselenatis]OIJ08175.1 C4-dicarboxylate ABC transporter substrate-binding protein [Anaerobacillus arseniciselenatis]
MKKMLIIFASLILLLAACSGENNSSEDGGAVASEDLFITIATGGTSGVYYPIGGALSNLIEANLGFDTSVQATGASVENVNLLDTNRAELAITMADTVLQAYEGSGAFDGETPKSDLRGLTALYPNFVQLVTTADTGINSVEDLRGKRVGVGAPNSGVELNARIILEAHGMSYDDINEDYLSYSEAVDQIKNGMVDAAFVTSGVPNATVIDLSTTHTAKIVPIEGAAMEYLEENYPFFSANVIPAGAYDNDKEIPTASITNLLLVNHQLSEEVVYDMTKAIFENIEAVHGSHNAAKNISLDTVDVGMPIPFHPGAEKYFKEVGALD